MKVLIISSNTLPAFPSGPAYLAGAVRQAGHEVEIFECLFSRNIPKELAVRLRSFQPDVVGISIRLVFSDEIIASAPQSTRHTDLRPRIREIVEVVRQTSNACIVLGGPGFNYYAVDWLDYLGVDYGIRGEGEESFPLFLKNLAEDGNIYSIPGIVYRKDGRFHEVESLPVENQDLAALPAYDLLDMRKYARHGITPAIISKRGCAFSCTFCPYSKLEGKRYRVKSPERVLAEIRSILQFSPNRKVMFCDNNFNIPLSHANTLCQAFIKSPFGFGWGTIDLKPIRVTDDFCKLMQDSGCFYVNLAIESASETMLKRMKRGYTIRQVRESLESLSRSNIPFSASLLIGAPGETPETIAETLELLNEYSIPEGVWVTLGVYLWTDLQDVVGEIRQAGLLSMDRSLFSGVVYISPELSKSYLEDLMTTLRSMPGYEVQLNKPNQIWKD